MRGAAFLFRRIVTVLLLILIHLGITSTCLAAVSGESCRSDSISGDIRGGAIDNIDEKTVSVIKQFLTTISSDDESKEFFIQGWRWHCMSLIRDADRLEKLATRLSRDRGYDDSGLEALVSAADFVVNVNMAGLYRVESTMFVKWLQKNLCSLDAFDKIIDTSSVAAAFDDVINKIDKQRVYCERIGKKLYETASASANSSIKNEERQRNLREVVQLSTRLSDQLHSMRTLQEMLIVPSISVVVSSSEQKTFNNKVLLRLGLLESRIHLVGMHDAVYESENEIEKDLFVREIPYVARIMIERWRKSLYSPKGAWALDYEVANQ